MNHTWNIAAPLPLKAITVVAAFAVWVIIGAGVVATLGELGPLITSLRAR
jgi:hypothetical protein